MAPSSLRRTLLHERSLLADSYERFLGDPALVKAVARAFSLSTFRKRIVVACASSPLGFGALMAVSAGASHVYAVASSGHHAVLLDQLMKHNKVQRYVTVCASVRDAVEALDQAGVSAEVVIGNPVNCLALSPSALLDVATTSKMVFDAPNRRAGLRRLTFPSSLRVHVGAAHLPVLRARCLSQSSMPYSSLKDVEGMFDYSCLAEAEKACALQRVALLPEPRSEKQLLQMAVVDVSLASASEASEPAATATTELLARHGSGPFQCPLTIVHVGSTGKGVPDQHTTTVGFTIPFDCERHFDETERHGQPDALVISVTCAFGTTVLSSMPSVDTASSGNGRGTYHSHVMPQLALLMPRPNPLRAGFAGSLHVGGEASFCGGGEIGALDSDSDGLVWQLKDRRTNETHARYT